MSSLRLPDLFYVKFLALFFFSPIVLLSGMQLLSCI